MIPCLMLAIYMAGSKAVSSPMRRLRLIRGHSGTTSGTPLIVLLVIFTAMIWALAIYGLVKLIGM
jgi:hypothetical protein